MTGRDTSFHDANRFKTPIRDLGLTIAGTRLEPILGDFQAELGRVGLANLRPRFYLSTEWGVPSDTVAIAIPFYLVSPDLVALHAERVGHVEGTGHDDILRYLRHEMGHVVNYAYRLFEDEEWVRLFGSMTQPYLEDYRPQAFSRRFVRHLPGWYAQKHPDEDWAETFAVWMTPGRDWRADYADWPEALGKLEYAECAVAALRERQPLVTDDAPDLDVSELETSIDDLYGTWAEPPLDLPPGLDGALRAIFEELGVPEDGSPSPRRPASELIRRLEIDVAADVYRWTGHFPERTRALLRRLAERADALRQVYPVEEQSRATVAFTTLVTALAMNYVVRGRYLP